MGIRDEIIDMVGHIKLVSVPVTETSHLYLDLGIDSLAFMGLLVKIEGIYAIAFSLLEMGECLRMDRLIALVESKVKEPEHDSRIADESNL